MDPATGRCNVAEPYETAVSTAVSLRSGRLDLNQRPFGPQPNALPDCATPRGGSILACLGPCAGRSGTSVVPSCFRVDMPPTAIFLGLALVLLCLAAVPLPPRPPRSGSAATTAIRKATAATGRSSPTSRSSARASTTSGPRWRVCRDRPAHGAQVLERPLGRMRPGLPARQLPVPKQADRRRGLDHALHRVARAAGPLRVRRLRHGNIAQPLAGEEPGLRRPRDRPQCSHRPVLHYRPAASPWNLFATYLGGVGSPDTEIPRGRLRHSVHVRVTENLRGIGREGTCLSVPHELSVRSG